MKKMYGIFAMAAATLLFVTACTPEATTGMSDRDEAFTLSAPTGLNAQVGHGYVYLTWNNVDNAQQYAIYRRNPNGSRNLLGIVDVYNDAPYVSRAAIVGGANTYLDYLNLDNTYTEAGTYYYSVQAQRRDEEDTNTDTNDLNYADSVNSAELAVAITTVPAKGSLLPAVENLSVTYYGDYGVAVNWDDLPSAAFYYVHVYSQADEDYLDGLAQEDETIRTYLLRDGSDGILVYGDSQQITQTSVYFDDRDYSDFYIAVEAFPRDDYYYPNGGQIAFQDIPEATLGMITDLEATSTHETEIILEFSAVEGADSYEIWRSNIGYSGWTQLTTVETSFEDITSDQTGIRYHDTYELEQGIGQVRKYWYRVRAVAGTGDTAELSYFSNIAYGSIPALDGGDSLGTIVNLEATGGEFSNKIELTWTAVEDAELYTIYRSDDNAETYNILEERLSVNDLEADEDKLIYFDNDVEAGDTIDGTKYYWYKVVAIDTNWGIDGDQEVHSPFSTSMNRGDGTPFNRGWVSPNTVIEVTPDATLAAPSILYYGQGAANNIRIQWTAVEADADTGALAATGYEVYYSTVDDGEYTLIATTSTSAVTQSVLGDPDTTTWLSPVDDGYDLGVSISYNGFENGVPYYFMVKSVNSTESMWSIPSNSTVNWLNSLDTPSVTGGFVVTSNNTFINGNLAITMTAAITGADAYSLIVSTVNDYTNMGARLFPEEAVTEADILSGDYVRPLTNLTGSTQYYYWIHAVSTDGAVGEEAYSASRTFTTPDLNNPAP